MVSVRLWFLCGLMLGAGLPVLGGWPGLAFSVAALPGFGAPTAWPDLPQDVWTLKASDFPDGAGAVVLLERVHFHRRSMERFRRLLVLAEPGRQLAEFQLIGAKVKKLEGRTISPEGAIQTFVQNSDIVKSVLLSGKRENLDAVKVIPPGVAAHCVVEVRWVEPIDAEERPVPDGYDYNLLLSLSGAAPVRLSEITFDDDVADFGWRKKFEVQAGQKYRQVTGEGRTAFLFEDIPARPKVPLASEADLRAPVANWFLVPQVREWLTYLGFPADKPINVIDGAAKTIFYRYAAEPVEKNKGFRKVLLNMGQGIEGSVRERAVALIKALRGRMKTITELPSLPPRKEYEADLDAALERGWGTHSQICLVALHLLRNNSLDASLVFAIDREENRMLDPNNIWQYDYMLLTVPDEKGQLIYLNPGSTFYPLGVPPWTQASQSLSVHPGKERLDWTAQILPMPAEPAEQNTQTWKVSITPGEDADSYQASLLDTGQAASRLRAEVAEQHAATLEKGLKPLLEKQGFRLLEASGTGASDPWGEFTLSLRGSVEHDGGRRRLILPFPFLIEPFPSPASWPATRTTPIHLPLKTLIVAEANIPWRGPFPDPQDLAALEHENPFGRVHWSAEAVDDPTGKALRVKLEVKVQGLVGGVGLYPQIKAFSGWIQEALHRGVPAPQP